MNLEQGKNTHFIFIRIQFENQHLSRTRNSNEHFEIMQIKREAHL